MRQITYLRTAIGCENPPACSMPIADDGMDVSGGVAQGGCGLRRLLTRNSHNDLNLDRLLQPLINRRVMRADRPARIQRYLIMMIALWTAVGTAYHPGLSAAESNPGEQISDHPDRGAGGNEARKLGRLYAAAALEASAGCASLDGSTLPKVQRNSSIRALLRVSKMMDQSHPGLSQAVLWTRRGSTITTRVIMVGK